MTTINLPFAASGSRRIPTAAELADGYSCGPLDNTLDNWLEWWTSGQLTGAMAAAGLTVDDSDLTRLGRAIRSQRSNFVAAAGVSGTANAITLSFSPTAFASLADLVGTPLVFMAEATNTLATTLAVDALGAVALTWPDGTALAAGDIVNGALLIARYDGTAYRMQQCLSPTQVRGLVRATATYGLEAQPATNNIASGGSPTSLISAYAASPVNGLINSTFTGGILTIGSQDAGLYVISAKLNTNMPKAGTAGTATTYSAVLSIDKSTDGGATYLSQAAQETISQAASIFGPFMAPAATVRLNAADKLRISGGHNAGVTLNMPVALTAVNIGR